MDRASARLLVRRFLAILVLLAAGLAQGGQAWLPVQDVSLMVEKDSILDLSSLSGIKGPVGKRLVVNGQGQFVREDQTAKPLRFNMGSLGFAVATGSFPSHEMADRYVEQFRVRGYGMVRLDFVESTLMSGRKADFDFDPEQFDRFHYLLAALREAGVYYVLNGLSSGNGAYGNVKDRWINSKFLDIGVHYDPVAQDHWKRMMDAMLGTLNRYTGQSILEDPALAGLILANEGGLAFVTRQGSPEGLQRKFAEWLRLRYGTTVALAQAWGGELGREESLESGRISLPVPDDRKSRRMSDAQRFHVETEQQTVNWMTAHLRSRGFKGTVTAYNDWLSPATQLSRAQFQWVDMHNYATLPGGDSYQGMTVRQDSMLAGNAEYIRNLAVSRQIGRAYSVTEYGQPFWNRYRRETALAFPAYAALQDWSFICQHSGAVDLTYAPLPKRPHVIGPFAIGLDPVTRAGEVLATLLFQRGDVASSRAMIGVQMSDTYIFEQQGLLGAIPSNIARLGFVTGIGLDIPTGRNRARVHAYVDPEFQSVQPGGLSAESLAAMPAVANWAQRGFVSGQEGIAWRQVIFAGGYEPALRKMGVLSARNLTDPVRGIFQSDTEQIVLDSARRRLAVVTEMSEAVTFDEPVLTELNVLKVESADGPMLISVSSRDGLPLRESHRMLAMLVTDARNTGMRFQDVGETQLAELGRTPVVLRVAQARISLKNLNGRKLSVYSVNLRGMRVDPVSVERRDDGISVAFDTGNLPHGPTVFFEITDDAAVSR